MSNDIVIKKELRPCVVEIPEKKQIGRASSYGVDPPNWIETVVRKAETHNALFHTWSPVTQKSGIVEYEDGTVHCVEPEWIRFIDNKAEEYCFETKNR